MNKAVDFLGKVNIAIFDIASCPPEVQTDGLVRQVIPLLGTRSSSLWSVLLML